MDLFGFNADFGFNFGESEKETTEVAATDVSIADTSVSVEDSDNDLFGNFGMASDSFFEIPKKETKKKEEKPKKEKATVKDVSKKENNKFDVDVKLPVTVKARSFSEEITGEGVKKLSEIWNILLEKGYDQFKMEKFSLFYHELSGSVFVCDNSLMSDDDNSLVTLVDGKVVVVDGQFKSEFTLEDFPGVEEDELSLLHVKLKFEEINPSYVGCKLCYDEKNGICYPVLSEVSEKDFSGYSSYIKEGTLVTIAEETYADLKGVYGDMSQKNGGVDVLVFKGGNGTVFISFRQYNGYKPGGTSTSTGKSSTKQKVEEKFNLPLKVFVANWGQEFTITDNDMSKNKVTLKEIRDYLGKSNKIFKDSSRKMDHLYDKENSRLSVMFVSGSKGCELIRTEEEYEEVRKGTSFFDGVYTEMPHENVRVRVLPAGNFLSFFGKGLKAGEFHRMEWERKLPKIPAKFLDEIISIFRKDLQKEAAARVYYNLKTGEFSVKEARGEKTKIRINYLYDADKDIMMGDKIQVLDVHSHNTFEAFFSKIDDHDDAGFPCLSAVVGRLQDDEPEMVLRAGVDGVFTSYPISEVFDI